MNRTLLTFTFLALLAACGHSPSQTPPPLPQAPATPLDVGLAGAPIALFGPEGSPTFEHAFDELAGSGFNVFFPLFLITENDDESVYSSHGSFFLAPSLSGAPAERSCAGIHDPYIAAEGRMSIWYPGVQLVGLFDLSNRLSAPDLQNALSLQRSECPSSASVTAFYAFDEPSLQRVAAGYLGEPQLAQENVATLVRTVRETWGLPVATVEGPGELSLRLVGLADDEADRLVETFWEDARSIAALQDAYGFNVYPVPDFPLTLAGDYVRHARDIAPTQRIISVLQGMAFGRITGDPNRGRAPTQAEIRFQAVDSVAGGADVIFWYGASSLDLEHPDDARLWDDIRAVASELRAVREAVTGEVVVVPQVEGLWVRAHRNDDELVVFVSHRQTAPATHRLNLGSEWSVVEVVAGPRPTLDANGWSIELDGFDAAILRFR